MHTNAAPLIAHHFLFVIALLARQGYSDSCTFHNLKINITTMPGPPVMTELQTNKTIFKPLYTGRFTSLQCCTVGNPSPKVTWYKDNQALDLTNFRYKLMSNNQSLWIQSIRLTDAGLYSCQARNYHGHQYRRFKVTVTKSTVLQKPVVILKPNSWSTLVNTNITLTCIVKKSARRPMITWHYNSTVTRPLQRYTGQHIVKVVKMDEEETWCSNLTIFNVTKNDEGVYICVATNGIRGKSVKAQDSGFLSVNDPPLPKTSPPRTKGRQTGDNQEPVPTAIVLVIIASVITLILIPTVVWWVLVKRSGHSGHISDDNHYQPGGRQELRRLVNNDGTNPYEIPEKNLELLRQQAGEKPFDFDVFISYSSKDRDFVKNVLFDELSTTHSVCIDFKDFEAGTHIGENIYNCIVQSRKTLLVVSSNFLNGVWTYFEMQIAEGRLAQGHNALIPVIIEDIPYDDLPRPLQYYRQTTTYLEYFNEDVQPHFWDRLGSAIGRSIKEDNMVIPVPEENGNDVNLIEEECENIDNVKVDKDNTDDMIV